MSKNLAAIYAQVYGFCLDLSLVEFMESHSVKIQALKNNLRRIETLLEKILPALKQQNSTCPTSLTLELEHLLINSFYWCKNYLNGGAAKVGSSRPKGGAKLQFCLYGSDIIMTCISTINDIDTLLKKLNTVFYCMSQASAINLLTELQTMLQDFRGISPIPYPDTYTLHSSCLECVHDAHVFPNQGSSFATMLQQNICYHLFPHLPYEPCPAGVESEPSPAPTTTEPLPDAPLASCHHNIFSPVTTETIYLSTLLYWTANDYQTSENSPQEAKCSELSKIFTKEAARFTDWKVHVQKRNIPFFNHYFCTTRPTPLQLLFSGGLCTSHCHIIDALKEDCTQAFLKKVQYSTTLTMKSELFHKLSQLLSSHTTENHSLTENMTSISSDFETKTLSDAEKRKQAYFKKLSTKGVRDLVECLNKQTSRLQDMLIPRVWGSLLYHEVALLMNHFISRKRLMSQIGDTHLPTEELQKNSTFIKTSMYGHTLNNDHLSSLAHTYYSLLVGPLEDQDVIFHTPLNIVLAQALDAAGWLPHQKHLIAFDVNSVQSPRDWIDPTFNKFYSFPKHCLTAIQKTAWRYIRELVLSVAAYNIIWERQLRVVPIRAQLPFPLENITRAPGVYLTFEEDAPLILVCQNGIKVFKDIYAMLYHHLYLSSP
ncbi:transport protein [Cricetid gammaherpesvirus 2]|uniref:Transport protein n=1 Tax=Cricetid gammaherpesvirus 2 TaxID=1605972 RepID=E9M5J4_9GAMA|nr:transport protein [Cricetid gammaherpesvirus 2]ADW24352.1 transport protein [Cricetid gammaherpesvirus 2]ADW24434.1 transport protein [Cricetid gammaherpesvirus 2]